MNKIIPLNLIDDSILRYICTGVWYKKFSSSLNAKFLADYRKNKAQDELKKYRDSLGKNGNSRILPRIHYHLEKSIRKGQLKKAQAYFRALMILKGKTGIQDLLSYFTYTKSEKLRKIIEEVLFKDFADELWVTGIGKDPDKFQSKEKDALQEILMLIRQDNIIDALKIIWKKDETNIKENARDAYSKKTAYSLYQESMKYTAEFYNALMEGLCEPKNLATSKIYRQMLKERANNILVQILSSEKPKPNYHEKVARTLMARGYLESFKNEFLYGDKLQKSYDLYHEALKDENNALGVIFNIFEQHMEEFERLGTFEAKRRFSDLLKDAIEAKEFDLLAIRYLNPEAPTPSQLEKFRTQFKGEIEASLTSLMDAFLGIDPEVAPILAELKDAPVEEQEKIKRLHKINVRLKAVKATYTKLIDKGALDKPVKGLIQAMPTPKYPIAFGIKARPCVARALVSMANKSNMEDPQLVLLEILKKNGLPSDIYEKVLDAISDIGDLKVAFEAVDICNRNPSKVKLAKLLEFSGKIVRNSGAKYAPGKLVVMATEFLSKELRAEFKNSEAQKNEIKILIKEIGNQVMKSGDVSAMKELARVANLIPGLKKAITKGYADTLKNNKSVDYIYDILRNYKGFSKIEKINNYYEEISGIISSSHFVDPTDRSNITILKNMIEKSKEALDFITNTIIIDVFSAIDPYKFGKDKEGKLKAESEQLLNSSTMVKMKFITEYLDKHKKEAELAVLKGTEYKKVSEYRSSMEKMQNLINEQAMQMIKLANEAFADKYDKLSLSDKRDYVVSLKEMILENRAILRPNVTMDATEALMKISEKDDKNKYREDIKDALFASLYTDHRIRNLELGEIQQGEAYSNLYQRVAKKLLSLGYKQELVDFLDKSKEKWNKLTWLANIAVARALYQDDSATLKDLLRAVNALTFTYEQLKAQFGYSEERMKEIFNNLSSFSGMVSIGGVIVLEDAQDIFLQLKNKISSLITDPKEILDRLIQANADSDDNNKYDDNFWKNLKDDMVRILVNNNDLGERAGDILIQIKDLNKDVYEYVAQRYVEIVNSLPSEDNEFGSGSRDGLNQLIQIFNEYYDNTDRDYILDPEAKKAIAEVIVNKWDRQRSSYVDNKEDIFTNIFKTELDETFYSKAVEHLKDLNINEDIVQKIVCKESIQLEARYFLAKELVRIDRMSDPENINEFGSSQLVLAMKIDDIDKWFDLNDKRVLDVLRQVLYFARMSSNPNAVQKANEIARKISLELQSGMYRGSYGYPLMRGMGLGNYGIRGTYGMPRGVGFGDGLVFERRRPGMLNRLSRYDE